MNQLLIHSLLELLMAIRKNLAKQFINVANALENDASMERLAATIGNARVGITNVVMPKIFAVRVGIANAIMPDIPFP
jgi:hypothetical protein